ncbi:MAG: alpha/beta fold hydrolase [Solirubrobacteraceae bacterium]
MHDQPTTVDTAAFGDQTYEWPLADGRMLGYGLYGASDGPLVVVLDGPGSRGLARAMASPATQLGIKLLAPDRPGFGCSTPARAGSIAAVSSDLLALVDHLGFTRFGLVAQSGGTPYALAVAAAAGDRVTGLAFVGGLAPLDEPRALQDVARPMRIAFMLARRAPWVMRLFLNGAARQTAKDPEAVARKYAATLPPDDRCVLADPTLWAIHATSSAEITSRPAAFALETRMLVRPWSVDYGRISAPAALWVGELDRTHPLSMSRRLATLLGGAPVTVVAGAATFAMLPCFPDVLRHAAALPEDAAPSGQQALRPETATSNEEVGWRADSTRR